MIKSALLDIVDLADDAKHDANAIKVFFNEYEMEITKSTSNDLNKADALSRVLNSLIEKALDEILETSAALNALIEEV